MKRGLPESACHHGRSRKPPVGEIAVARLIIEFDGLLKMVMGACKIAKIPAGEAAMWHSLVRNGGVMIMSLRHGAVPPGRRMFEVAAEETIALAQPLGLHCVLHQEAEPSLRQPGVTWTRLAFRRPPS